RPEVSPVPGRNRHARSARCARDADERIPEDACERMGRVAGDGGSDDVVAGAGERRDVAAAVVQERVGIAPAPLLVEQIAEAEVLDPGAAPVHDLAERTGDGEYPEER